MKINPIPLVAAPSERERQALSELRRILNTPGLLRASIIRAKRRCGRSYCRCAKAKRHWHLAWYMGQSQGGRTRMKYISSELVPKIRLWVERYQEAKKLLDEVSNENWNKIIRRTDKKR